MRYKAEFFDRAFKFVFWSKIPEPEIMFDYLTLDKTSIIIPAVEDILRGWYCHITRGADVVYQGIVSGIDEGKASMTVQLSPLISLFDFQFYSSVSSCRNTGIPLSSYRTFLRKQWRFGSLSASPLNPG